MPHSLQHLPAVTCKFCMDVRKPRGQGRGNTVVVTWDWTVNQKIALNLTETKIRIRLNVSEGVEITVFTAK